MGKAHTYLTDNLASYMERIALRDSDLLRRLREETEQNLPGVAAMQVSPEQGQFLRLIALLLGAKRTLEVGVFTGYSSLSVALALPTDGQIIACDVNEQYTAIARRYWAEAGVADRIDLRLAPALQTLDALLADGLASSFDFAFIDADKTNYLNYYERCLQLLRPGGLIVADNVLWDGLVADPSHKDSDTEALRQFNERLHADNRVDISIVPLGDGLTLARKKDSI